MAAKELRINEAIRSKEIRLIGDGGEQKVISLSQALQMAAQEGVDLVEVAPQANPPVCKLMDYGKYKFEQDKRLKESKKSRSL